MEQPSRAPYDPEFRAHAVELVRTRGLSRAHVARDLGSTAETLRLWIKQADIDAGQRDGLTSDEQAELSRLRRENRILREEREIFKKAAALFARERAP
jgi:transposase